MRRQEAPEVYQDAWGDDDDNHKVAAGIKSEAWGGFGRSPASASRQAVRQPLPRVGPQAGAEQQRSSAQRRDGPPSLHSICLGVLGEHLPELLSDPECRQHLLPALPAEIKACLLAVARLRALLCDAALLALADEGHSILDLHGCGAALTDAGIRQALPLMPNLRLVDLSSCAVGAATLRTLGRSCPGVEVLRLGSAATDASAGSALADVLPVLEQRQQAPAADSWDDLLAVDDAHQLAAAVVGAGRLMHLQCLCWPNIPFRAEQRCRSACPRVALNPSAEEVAARRLPPTCKPDTQLDAPLLAGVAGWERWVHPARVPEGPPVVHIAERFRLAYVSREQRVRAKQERNWQQQRRREVRSMGASEAAIRQWESEL